METPTRYDVLAANLLFATLALTLLHQVAGWVAQALNPAQTIFHPMHFTFLTVAALGLLLLVRGALYYGVRRGFLAAKLLLALGLLAWLYNTTRWSAGIVAGVSTRHFGPDSLLLLLTDLLTLAALVLMFWPSRDGVR